MWYILQFFCMISTSVTLLALAQIFGYLYTDARVFVLSTFFNSILRMGFMTIVIFICARDITQITVNMEVQNTGAMVDERRSRWIKTEYFVRMGISILAGITIITMIWTTPRHDDENEVDQTMNFTALVILLDIDNILGGILQKRIDKLGVNFDYDPLTAEFEFNRAADFFLARKNKFWVQYRIENIL